MSNYRTLDDFSPKGKRVLVRVDLNVPMQGKRITDKSRILKVLPTITRLSKSGAKVIILSHFGRPNSKYNDDLSLRHLMPTMQDALKGFNISFSNGCIGTLVHSDINMMKEGDILLLENLRFHAGEELNDPGFSKKLSDLGDIFVNEAFSASHRTHSSISSLAHLLPSYAGILLQSELESLARALETPQRPLGAIIGGAKVSTKLELLENLVKKVDLLIIGGGMANTFLFARGIGIGKSLAERNLVETVKNIEKAAEIVGCKIVLQNDAVVAGELKQNPKTETLPITSVPLDSMILDAGPASVQEFSEQLSKCKTIIWNGPLGAFEISPFHEATVSLAKFVACSTKNKGLTSVAGGGDTVAALTQAGVEEEFSYLSTAGGAFLEWLEGKELPGITPLKFQKK